MKITPKIILTEPVRDIFLKEHDFYVEQAKSRIFNSFKSEDIEKDVRKATEDFYRQERLEGCYGEDVDEESIAENAIEHGIDFGITLHEMKFQVILAMLASMYHQWEKKLRDFMERELKAGYNDDELEKIFWKSNIDCLYDELERLGWYIRKEVWFPKIDACRLIVNVYKHGKGPALVKLKEKHPEYLKGIFKVDKFFGERDEMLLSYEDLSITIEGFNEIADAFRQFWIDFPCHEDQHKNDIPF